MKRWTRSLPSLLSFPIVMLTWSLINYVAPDQKSLVDLLCGGGCFLLMMVQMFYLFRRDNNAFEAMGGVTLLFASVYCSLDKCGLTDLADLIGQPLFLVYGGLFTILVVGGMLVLGPAIAIQPRDWWTSFQAWQRKPSAVTAAA